MESFRMAIRSSLAIILVAALCAFMLLPSGGALAQESQGGSLMAASVDDSAEAETENYLSTAASSKYANKSVLVRALVQNGEWGDWLEAGATVGDTEGKGIRSLELQLTGANGLAGSIEYATYRRGIGWLDTAADGAATKSVRNVEAVKISLTGDVSAHYDVLYRTYVSGAGWTTWAKNGESSGLIGAKRRVNAVQVMLSPKIEEAIGKKASRVGVFYQTRFHATGWQTWRYDGLLAGRASGSKGLSGFEVLADTGSLTGGVKYCAYTQSGWQDWVRNGEEAGGSSENLEAFKVKLTGKLSKKFDVYYRAYCQSSGWLDWAKNGQVSGSTGMNLRLQAYQIKLVAKGGAAPCATQYRTVNQLEKSKTLDGIDVSSWQAGVDVAQIDADFIIIKATGGVGYTNPYYKEWADATLASGKLVGFYHYARESGCEGSAEEEARYFANAVKPYAGRAVLFLDFEGDALYMDDYQSWVSTFMKTVKECTGVKPLLYISKNYTWYLDWSSVAGTYGLWVAQYPNYEPVYGYLDDPWTDSYGYGAWSAPTLFQYTSTGRLEGYGSNLDLDKFYGSALTWRKLAKKS